MTIETLDTFTDWVAANGSNKNWNYDFTIFDAASAYIEYKNGADGVVDRVQADVAFVPDADYVGGYLQYPSAGAALANTYFVRVVRVVPFTQSAAIGNEGSFYPEIHERAFDKMTLQVQQIDREVQRALKVPLGDLPEDVPIVDEGNILVADGTGGFLDGEMTIPELQGDVDAAAASAVAAAASAAEASADAAAADADRITVAADKATVAADKATVAADKATVAADKATVAADKGIVAADKAIVAGYRDEVEADRLDVQADKVLAAGFADDAANSAATALAAKDQVLAYGDFNNRYLGEHAADPTEWNEDSPLDPGTDPLVAGLIYYNTVASEYRTYSGSVWDSGSTDTSDFAQKSLNGSDYNAATFRTNIDVYSKATVDAFAGAAAAKTTPIDADSVAIVDSADGNAQKRTTFANLWAWVESKLNGSNKATPLVADRVAILDTAAGNVIKYSTLTQIMAVIFASPALTGNPTAPNQSAGTNNTRIANTAYVDAAITAIKNGVSAAFDTLAEIETALNLKAPLASPALTGTPTAPTAAPATNTTQIATTAFVLANASGLAAATQAEMEAASATNVAVTPGRQQFHPSAAKFWGKWNNSGTLSASYNITSITDNSTGNHIVNIATDFSSANWAIFCAALGSNYAMLFPNAQAAGTIQLLALNFATTPTITAGDPSGSAWFACGYGDQA